MKGERRVEDEWPRFVRVYLVIVSCCERWKIIMRYVKERDNNDARSNYMFCLWKIKSSVTGNLDMNLPTFTAV